MKTIKLYDTDSHIKTFEATVQSCVLVNSQNAGGAIADAVKSQSAEAAKSGSGSFSLPKTKAKAKDLYALVLDTTAFFAEGGGQAADKGCLYAPVSAASTTDAPDSAAPATDAAVSDDQAADAVTQAVPAAAGAVCLPVLDVQEKDGIVYHFVSSPVEAGEKVRGELDWEFRFTNMQQHSGEHILSGIAYAWKGYHNVGFHMGKEVTTIDFDGPLTKEEIALLEKRGNEVIYENQPVVILYPTKEELDQMDYRSKKELSGDIRIVKVGDTDLCACCAPHVRKTGEVGVIKIVHAENYKGGVRLSIVCGMRAVEDYVKKHGALERMADTLTTKIDNVEKQMEKTLKESYAMHERIVSLQQSLIKYKVKELLAEQEDLGHVRMAFVEEELDEMGARSLVNHLLEHMSGTAAVLLPKGTEETPDGGKTYMFLMGSNQEDLRDMAKMMREKLGARGGGSSSMIQGTVCGKKESLLEALRALKQ